MDGRNQTEMPLAADVAMSLQIRCKISQNFLVIIGMRSHYKGKPASIPALRDDLSPGIFPNSLSHVTP
jgi:hypothetical protein